MRDIEGPLEEQGAGGSAREFGRSSNGKSRAKKEFLIFQWVGASFDPGCKSLRRAVFADLAYLAVSYFLF
jgi:hypothetical protein